MDAPPVALVSLLTTDRRLIYRPVQHLTSCQSGVWAGAGNKAIERLTWSISSGNNYGDACQASLNSKGLTAQGWVATGSDACTEDNQICTVDNVRCFAVRLN